MAMAQQRSASPPDGASPVLMLRSLPEHTTVDELMAWAQSFTYQPRDERGRECGPTRQAYAKKALVLNDRHIGFVEFCDIWASRCIMSQFMYNSPSIVLHRHDRSHPLNLVYSDKQDIRSGRDQGGRRQRPDGPRSSCPVPVSTSDPAATGACMPPGSSPPPLLNSSMTAGPDGEPSRLLLVVLKDLCDALLIDVLFWTFSQFGPVEKISTFTKDGKNQVVVQFIDHTHAESAMGYLNGRQLPNPKCLNQAICFLAIVPSRLGTLTFRNEDSKNRDYTRTNELLHWVVNQPRQPQRHEVQLMLAREAQRADAPLPALPDCFDFLWGQHRWGLGWLFPLQQQRFIGMVPPAPSQGQVGTCMHLAGLPERDEIFGARHLFRLCSTFGSVHAVKLLFKHKGCALVQFECPGDRENVMQLFHEVRYRGRTWDAKPSPQRNATHWNGSSDTLQKRMCSVLDSGMQNIPLDCNWHPRRLSQHVTFWGIDCTMDDHILAGMLVRFLALNRVGILAAPVVRADHQGRRVTLTLQSVEDAIALICGHNAEPSHVASCLWSKGRHQIRFAAEEELGPAAEPEPPVLELGATMTSASSADEEPQRVRTGGSDSPGHSEHPEEANDFAAAPPVEPAPEIVEEKLGGTLRAQKRPAQLLQPTTGASARQPATPAVPERAAAKTPHVQMSGIAEPGFDDCTPEEVENAAGEGSVFPPQSRTLSCP
eukprot:TRINITY_DN12118_c0_g1_i1.p1 TRINITY_DN12118_c0_g1~~TRINITY_DN12118_c0_g1_i1.p1  ORF type:complete len:711 (+),score=189.16 TRINITY_DN12118_c0_g1_i1:117-2249(+)